MMPAAGKPGASAMLRVRLKADGRLVEIPPDGSERAISSDPRSIATAAHQAARSVDARSLDATYARSVRGQTGLTAGRVCGAHRRAGRDRAQLGAGQALAARSRPRAAQSHRAGPRRCLCGARQGEFPLAAERPFVVRIGLAFMPPIADPWSSRRSPQVQE